jgi:hypothetical protein
MIYRNRLASAGGVRQAGPVTDTVPLRYESIGMRQSRTMPIYEFPS